MKSQAPFFTPCCADFLSAGIHKERKNLNHGWTRICHFKHIHHPKDRMCHFVRAANYFATRETSAAHDDSDPCGTKKAKIVSNGLFSFLSRPPADRHNGAANFMTKVPLSELTGRMKRFPGADDAENPNWELAAFFGGQSILFHRHDAGRRAAGSRDAEAVFWVRRSFERPATIAFPKHPPDEKLSRRRPGQPCGGSGAADHSPRNRTGPARAGPAISKAFSLQRGGVAGCANRQGAGGQESV